MNKPIFHITPERGWMNDPNGLVEYKGVYHVFYQADPEHLVNEKIGWGHKKVTICYIGRSVHRHSSQMKVMIGMDVLLEVQ